MAQAVRPKEDRARINLEDGSVIHCTAKEIPLLVQYRLKARMDVGIYQNAYRELTGNDLPWLTMVNHTQ